jgi:hypothetical protein
MNLADGYLQVPVDTTIAYPRAFDDMVETIRASPARCWRAGGLCR